MFVVVIKLEKNTKVTFVFYILKFFYAQHQYNNNNFFKEREKEPKTTIFILVYLSVAMEKTNYFLYSYIVQHT